MSNKPAILVTGGAGYVGSETVYSLIENGFSPIVVDNLSTGFKEALPPCVFYAGDVRDTNLLEKIFFEHNIQAVIHLAAKMVVEESFRQSLEYYDNNVNGLLSLLQVCKKHEIKKIIFSSSGTVYGNLKLDLRMVDKISEKDFTNPISPYGSSKLMGERIIHDAKKDFGLASICLRYFNVAGARLDLANGQRRSEASHIVHVASRAAFQQNPEITIFGSDYETSDGTCVRDYIHVSDIADIHVQALKYLFENNENHTLNCGYGKGYTVRQVIETFNKINKVSLHVKYGSRRLGDPDWLVGDSSKLFELLQWKPRFADLEIICKSAFDWQLKLAK